MISTENKGLLTVIGCCIAISWPGALNFGFPGVMSSVFGHMLKITGYTPMTVIVVVLSLLTGMMALYIAKLADDLPDFSALKSKAPSGIKAKPLDESAKAKWLPLAMNYPGLHKNQKLLAFVDHMGDNRARQALP